MKQKILPVLSNLPGWRTNRKIIVFESDDWGSIRMSSNNTRDILVDKGVIPGSKLSHYYLFDAIESNEDLLNLFETLSAFKDKKGNHPVFTAINVVANPAFEKIRNDNFQEYYYEPFTKTLEKYPKHDQVYELWKQGVNRHIFVPQFHGREHLNVTAWMNALRLKKPKTYIAFEHGVCGIDSVSIGESSIQYQAAFDIYDPATEINYLEKVIRDGTKLFDELLNYSATYFVPPNGPFNMLLERPLRECGINYIMLDKLQKEPIGFGKHKKHLRYLGKRSKSNQIYLSRNASFEPAAVGRDWVSSCLKSIDLAFKLKKPATISTHRVNYIGFLNEANRTKGNTQLKILLKQILDKWPDVEFMTSIELGDLIRSNEK